MGGVGRSRRGSGAGSGVEVVVVVEDVVVVDSENCSPSGTLFGPV